MSEPLMNDDDSNVLTPVREKEKQAVKPPPLYKCMLLNDDYTTMEYVVDVLQRFFGHTEEAAMNIMLDVHNHGKGIAGIFPKDIAETKSQAVMQDAQKKEYPLMVEIEEQSDE